MDWSIGDVIWSVIVLTFWVLVLSMFVRVFADIWRRDDVSGVAKALWILLIVVLPFVGILIYVIARPAMTEQDRRIAAEELERARRLEGYSAADEVAKLAKLRDEREITAEEYEELRSRAML
ncbi:MAG TPA: SHOCT domain-containing protein [Actinomycetota bacterium]|nr:SHOCT domain-containing protein [Actinomycetota bacterium]